jgi:ankyrin repeat protein
MKKLITTLGIALLLCSTAVMASDRAESFSTITMANHDKATPLAIAIAKGDVESVKAFIQYGVNIDETSNDMTPLMIAARYNQVVIINLF